MAKETITADQKHRFLVWFWSIFGAGIVLCTFLFFLISKGWIGYMPAIDELENPKNKYATEIYSSDMEVIGTFFVAKENRVNVTYKELSPNLVHALVATEDARFYSHSGIDGWALARAVVLRGIFHRKGAGGGSTITQQLAKQLYSPPAQNMIQRALQKPIEWVISVQLERLYTKEEIMTMYLNKFDFLNNAVGIKTASQVYFGTTPDQLSIEQAATLVGMCKNPWLYNPVRRNEKSTQRRNVVLKQMEKADFITDEEFDSIKQIPLTLDYHKVDHKLGLAPYFREYLRRMLTATKPDRSDYASWHLVPYGQYYMDSLAWETDPLYGFIEKNPKSDGTKYNLYTDGLKIYTTIDSRMQRYAEEAVEKHFKELQASFFKEQKDRKKAPFARYMSDEDIDKFMRQAMTQTDRYRGMKRNGASEAEITKAFNTPVEMSVFSYNGIVDTIMSPLDSIRYNKHFARCGFMSMDPSSGHVKAYVGGPDFSHFQYDMVNMGRRQVGSTIKPFLYTLAMNEGLWPCDKTINQSITLKDGLGRDFTPRNGSKARRGEEVTLRWGLANSNNWITAYLMSLFTPEQLVKLMRSFGIKGELVPVVSLCLGPCEVTVAEMVDAYTTFPNKGIRVDPIYVTRIEDANGNIVAEFTPKTTEVIDEETSYKMLNMLTSVMDNGTGVRVRYRYNVNAPAGGKTGTTQNNSDGWFIGFTPTLVSGVWVGWEDRSVHFSGMAEGQGASMALPIWAYYMDKVLKDPKLGYDATEGFDVPGWFDSNTGCSTTKEPETTDFTE
ncbi:MAG: transglycosylase domain-containing protein [Paludibacteraceae bacterium]|nr:transglycosylase domain-containing protein [Paludibacteraceae bacterium]